MCIILTNFMKVDAKSSGGSERYPVDISVRQFGRLVSFQLPYIERRDGKVVYTRLEKSFDLCPLDKIDSDNSVVTISITTDSTHKINVSLTVTVKGPGVDWTETKDQKYAHRQSKSVLNILIFIFISAAFHSRATQQFILQNLRSDSLTRTNSTLTASLSRSRPRMTLTVSVLSSPSSNQPVHSIMSLPRHRSLESGAQCWTKEQLSYIHGSSPTDSSLSWLLLPWMIFVAPSDVLSMAM